MRIIAGRFKGKKLFAPQTKNIRPTSDRARENIFNILSHRFEGVLDQARVLDIFAGTGAFGCEALSRGAQFVLFVENSIEGRTLLRENTDALQLGGQTRIFNRDALDLGVPKGIKAFDLVFMDPPYTKDMVSPVLLQLTHGWLNKGALVVIEEHATTAYDVPNGYVSEWETTVGVAKFVFLRWEDPHA